ncbi:MAG TPA: hypothetical protein VN327_04220 [Pseudonocardiaceae bacterium]|nr:hypothetical protein [Pseudonocardiaceae bacterium]
MTEPEGTPPDAELDSESSTQETTTDINQESGDEEGTSNYQEAAEEAVTADYQARIEEFNKAETSVPLASMPTESGNLGKSGSSG